MSSIRLSKKHGLNPTLGVCFFCGEDTNEMALLGALKGDAEAPKRMVLSYQPCDKCLEIWQKGVPVIEATLTNNGSMPISKTPDGEFYPTGKWCVVLQEAAERIGIPAELGKPVLVDEEVYSTRFVVDENRQK